VAIYAPYTPFDCVHIDITFEYAGTGTTRLAYLSDSGSFGGDLANAVPFVPGTNHLTWTGSVRSITNLYIDIIAGTVLTDTIEISSILFNGPNFPAPDFAVCA
jgi:hypothetical protein